MSLKALIILHPGFEEMEAIAPIDLLSRADVSVTQAAIGQERLVTGRSGITLEATHFLRELPEDALYDAVIVPGGPGVGKIRGHETVCKILKRHRAADKTVACICAAPLLLLDAGLTEGLCFTAHPSAAEELGSTTDLPVVVDGNTITSQGAGTATEFALAIVEALSGPQTSQEIAASICWAHR
jgi:4-methyl-5(b-hydroxyethyl)-thiazole monophosphate biosynthesis